MKQNQHIEIPSKRLTILTVRFLLLLILNGFNANAQTIYKVQDFNSGSFISFGMGGTISVSPDNIVSKTGDIILKSYPSPAIFDLNVEAGKKIQLTYNKNVTLVGDHGGTIILAPKDSSPAGNGVFVTGPFSKRIILGGTMTIGTASVTPAGKYSGPFQVSITVIH